MASERDEKLAQAERHIRRGELAAAGDLLRLLRDLFPDDAAIGARLAAVTALDDPRHARPAAPPPRPLVTEGAPPRVNPVAASPRPQTEAAAPKDPVDVLSALLARIQQHRRD